ncbi:hypothetical protein CANARDRAFT_130438 [[Candida] arabinofermentans NRRL YB-2248]|uniref:SAP domain-containing protein n=1 Tax=[Candida] arabinofermentans NRRL YB-2248 TaxID=983967 RepID=A0A1E4T391_9ASCO|nr:hypothetical protein CANARDRAFT_130438 [[Candida] arabinofermentans NRRL YB-2248]
MLRSARSLPTLRVFYQQGLKQEASNTTLHTTYPKAAPINASSSRYLHSTPIQTNVYSNDDSTLTSGSKFVNIFKRGVHQTTKKQTVLLDYNSSGKYSSMNLQGLKMECKKRGLKISGKKIELVQRLSAADGSVNMASPSESRKFTTSTKTEAPSKLKKMIKGSQKQSLQEQPVVPKSSVRSDSKTQERTMSSTPTAQKKGDSSTIDFFKVPQNPFPEPDGIPPLKIPSLSTEASKKDKPVVLASPIGEVHIAEESSSTISSAGEILSKGELEGTAEPSKKPDAKDAWFFGTFAVLTVGWWSLKDKDGRH